MNETQSSATGEPSPTIASENTIPDEWRVRSPLMNLAGARLLRAMIEHLDAPRWNHWIGDRVTSSDHEAYVRYRAQVEQADSAQTAINSPPDWLHEFWQRNRRQVPWLLNTATPSDISSDFLEQWSLVPTTAREDLAIRMSELVPIDADLSRLIVYDTSGTTGHALKLPHHPKALAQNHALVERALRAHRALPQFVPGSVAAMHVRAQERTYIFANVYSVWNQAGFAKINLKDEDWPEGRASAARYLAAHPPGFVATDPLALAKLIDWDLPIKPSAIVSTGIALESALARQAASRFDCPIIDWYSTTETGPIGFSAADTDAESSGFELCAPDLYVEIVDATGRALPLGERGEIVVTGGRNPYLPLIRYRTGDFARLISAGSGASARLRLIELEGRRPVRFWGERGQRIDSVDVGRQLRLAADFVRHAVMQTADRKIQILLQPITGSAAPTAIDVERVCTMMQELFGRSADIAVKVCELDRVAEKLVPYSCEVEDD